MIGIRSGESTWQRRISNALRRGLFCITLLTTLLDLPDSRDYRASAAQASGNLAGQEKDECTRNLKLIYDAIEAYRKEHKDLPNWLSDLVPDYLPDANVLSAPSVAERAKSKSHPWLIRTYPVLICSNFVPRNWETAPPPTQPRRDGNGKNGRCSLSAQSSPSYAAAIINPP